ncbi:MAG: metallophosphoesterase family protein [Candidatus Thorarchaeota archaeon]
MRIAAISDIHVLSDGSDEPLLEAIRQRVLNLEPDVFVIAGDLSHHISTLEDTLAKLKIDGIANLYVPGNHDVWFEKDPDIGSMEKYARFIGEICRRRGFQYLPDAPYEHGSIGFVGSMGWSDYSFARPELGIPEEAYRRKEYGGATWFDVFNLDWELSDKEITDLFNKKVEYDLSILSKSVKQVVYISHHLPFRELTIYKDRLPWDFFSAYMGSVRTGEILQHDERVILTISGHSHVRNIIQMDKITAMTVPLGYCRPEEDKLESFVKKTVADIEIQEGKVSVRDFVKGDICEGMPYKTAR